jgi:hypothetical protein
MINATGRISLRPDSWNSARKIDRDEVDFGTTMRRSGGRDLDARVVNLSSHGFMVRTEGALEIGDLVTIALPIVGETAAKIVWALGGRVGGQFVTPIEQTRYAELIKKAYKPRLSWPA